MHFNDAAGIRPWQAERAGAVAGVVGHQRGLRVAQPAAARPTERGAADQPRRRPTQKGSPIHVSFPG